MHSTTSARFLSATELVSHLRTAVAVVIAVAAVFVLSRRLAGALETSPSALALLWTGLGLAVFAGSVRAVAPQGRQRINEWRINEWYIEEWLVSVAIVLIAASFSRSGSSLPALLGLWVPIVAEEIWAWRRLWPLRRRAGARSSSAAPSAPPAADRGMQKETEPAEPPADVLQQLTLRASAAGGQEMSGWLRLPLAAGQRTGTLHVVFCPAFRQPPQVEVQPVSGPDCRLKTAQILPYGARLDVKLDQPAGSDESVLVWFFASCG